MKFRFLLPAAAVAVLCGALWYGLSAIRGGRYDPQLIESPLIGRAAPDFVTENLLEPAQPISRAQFLGKPFVLNVWGTWCPGCREEHESLLAIAKETDIPIIGISWKDDRQLARDWLAQLGNPYRVVGVDPDGKIAIDWGVYGAPESFLVGANGRILHKRIGPMTLDLWRNDFVPLLATGSGSGRQ